MLGMVSFQAVYVWGFVCLLMLTLGLVGDIVHPDNIAPKKPGCNNKFVLVKVPILIDGVEDSEYVGIGARFGQSLESKEKHANHTRVALADPPDCCSKLKNELTGKVILVHRGNCSFTTKANRAEEAGASAILTINYRTVEVSRGKGKQSTIVDEDEGPSKVIMRAILEPGYRSLLHS